MRSEALVCILLSIATMGCSISGKTIPDRQPNVESLQSDAPDGQPDIINARSESPENSYCQKGERIGGWQCIGGLNEYDKGFWRCMQKSGCVYDQMVYPFNTDFRENGFFCADRRAPDNIKGYRCAIKNRSDIEKHINLSSFRDDHMGTWVCEDDTCDCMGEIVKSGVGCSMDGMDCDSISLCPRKTSPLTGYRKGELYCQGEPKSVVGSLDIDGYICSDFGWRCEEQCECGTRDSAPVNVTWYQGCRNGEITCGGETRKEISDNPNDNYQCDSKSLWICDSETCSCGHGEDAITIPKGSGCRKGRETCHARDDFEPEARPHIDAICDKLSGWSVNDSNVIKYNKPNDAKDASLHSDLPVLDGYEQQSKYNGYKYSGYELQCRKKDGCTCGESKCPVNAYCVNDQCMCGGKPIQPGYQCIIHENHTLFSRDEIEYGLCPQLSCPCGNGKCPQNTQCYKGQCLCNDHLYVDGAY